MSKKRMKLILEDLISFCSKLERYIKDMEKKEFQKNELVIDAVLRNLELIGEASKRLSDDFKNRNPQLPWKKIIGLRNIVIHAYSDVDIDIIWDIIKKNIPETKDIIKEIYEKEYS